MTLGTCEFHLCADAGKELRGHGLAVGEGARDLAAEEEAVGEFAQRTEGGARIRRGR